MDLTRLAQGAGHEGACLAPFSDPDPRLDRLGLASGSALAHVILFRAVERDPRALCPLILSVGEAVRAALPTAARTSVLSRSPLTGFLSEGQVGGTFGRTLASVADAVVLTGCTSVRGALLVVRADGRVELHASGGLGCVLGGATPRAVLRQLTNTFGPCAALAIGAAGEAEIPFASLVALEDPPSFVGRGGLGAVFGRLGLKAIVVLAPVVEPDRERVSRDRDLQRTLLSSPRLRARADGGTLELAASRHVGGDARPERNAAEVVASFERLKSASTSKKGCEGCPTPCGLVFERGHPDGSTRHVGRFGALSALGPALGLDASDARILLERCDELALDAKEVGAVLALARHASDRSDGGAENERENRARMLSLLDDIVARRGMGAVLALGARQAAIELGLEHASDTARGEASRPESNLAVRLGSAIGVRGADPMRAFPFLAVDAASRERLVAALSPFALPAGAEDPLDPAGKGRIVWWHENLACALDATGFCAFSAAGLLSDGVCTVDDLARLIAPREIARAPFPGQALLALGASIATLQRATTALLRADDERAAHDARTAHDARDPRIDHPSMAPEYARWRGIGTDGAPSSAALALLGDDAILDIGRAQDDTLQWIARDERDTKGVGKGEPVPIGPGTVSFHATGPLSAALAGPATLHVDLPARLDTCIEGLALAHPRAAPWLLIRDQMVPQAWRDGRRLAPGDAVRAGDRIDLVIAIGGG